MKKLFLVLMLLGGYVSYQYATPCANTCSSSCPPVSCRDGDLFCKNSSQSCINEPDCGRCKGYFTPRPITTNLLYQDALAYYYLHHMHDYNFCYNGTMLFEKSRHSYRLARLLLQGIGADRGLSSAQGTTFGIDETSCGILIAQDNDLAPDINAAWLNLSSSSAQGFISHLKISPERKVSAFNNQFYFDLSRCGAGFWADITFAFVHVRHDLHVCEDVEVPADTSLFHDATQALNNPAWNAGRFCTEDPCAGGLCSNSMTTNNIDDVQFRLGWQMPYCDSGQWGVYMIGTLGTGKKCNALECLFAPVIGTRSNSVGVGINGDTVLWESPIQDADFLFMIDCNYRYAFEFDACRSFDTCANGPLSRYMLVALESNPAQSLPAINFFTKSVNVQPRSTVQLWTALRYDYCEAGLEGGYNLWWRQREKISGCLFDREPIGIFDISGENKTSASLAQISQGIGQAISDEQFTPIPIDGFDHASGAAPSALTHQLYIGLSWKGNACLPFIMGMGGAVEFGGKHNDAKCAAVENWMLFFKALIGF